MQLLKGKNGRTADTPHKNGKTEILAIQTDDKSYRPGLAAYRRDS